MLFQITDYSPTGYAVNELKRLGRRKNRVCDQVQVIPHDHVGIQGKLARSARFIESGASNQLNLVLLKNGKAVLAHRSQVVTWRIAGDSMHGLSIRGTSRKDSCKSSRPSLGKRKAGVRKAEGFPLCAAPKARESERST